MFRNLNYLYAILTAAFPAKLWQLLVLAFVVTNVKCFPLVWHVRLARAFFAHFPYHRYSAQESSFIFQPVIVTSRSPILECDYNLHKSNSLYFTDLEISRGHLLTCLLGNGIYKTRLAGREEGSPNQGRFGFYLGGVTCHFRRELKPFEAFEVWTRILCWDEKWLYLVSHIVKAGRVKPQSYVLQPWRQGDTRSSSPSRSSHDRPHPAIFASSIAKYVFKRGRVTIAPETVLEQANLIPVKPDDVKASSSAHSTLDNHSRINATTWPTAQRRRRIDADVVMDATMDLNSVADVWDWERVEVERTRGMQIAIFMAGLDQLDQEFTGDTRNALGQF